MFVETANLFALGTSDEFWPAAVGGWGVSPSLIVTAATSALLLFVALALIPEANRLEIEVVGTAWRQRWLWRKYLDWLQARKDGGGGAQGVEEEEPGGPVLENGRRRPPPPRT